MFYKNLIIATLVMNFTNLGWAREVNDSTTPESTAPESAQDNQNSELTRSLIEKMIKDLEIKKLQENKRPDVYLGLDELIEGSWIILPKMGINIDSS